MNESYGYEFFVEALENRSLRICETTNMSDKDFAEIFLINSVLISMKKFGAFDLLVKKYGNNIPIVLQVGMNHCAAESKGTSPIVKKYIKQHRKKVGKNKSLRESIIALYDNPIDEEAASELRAKLVKNLN